MKKALIALGVLLALLAVTTGLIFAYLEMRKERDLEASSEAPVVPPSRIQPGPASQPVIQLDPETRQRLGLVTTIPSSDWLTSELTATARVLPASSLSQQLNTLRSATTALETATRELDRKKKLFRAGGVTSAAELDTSESITKQKQIDVDSARNAIVAAWGTPLSQREDLPELAQSLLTRASALVQIELSATDSLTNPPDTASLSSQNGRNLTTAQLLGPAPNIDSKTGGRSFLGLVITNANTLTPGQLLLAHLSTGDPQTAALIPRHAIIRHNAQGWVYVQVGPDRFTRQPVPLDHPHTDGWLIPGQWPHPIVITGAQSLLSEELKSGIQMRD